MKLEGARVLLTGATGGIGGELALQLAAKGARLVLVGRNRETLAGLCAKSGAQALSFDLSAGGDYDYLIETAIKRLGGIDLLINNAGEAAFTAFDTQDAQQLSRMLNINLLAPMLMARQALPHMRRGARIVNVGSVFGAIGFPYHAAYSATKFGLRGFSEALRRELSERGIGVTYVAPRATRTAMNSAALYRYAERARMAFDSPQAVAGQIVAAIEDDAAERSFGQPEGFFSRLNALLPRLVDRALRSQTKAACAVLKEASVLSLEKEANDPALRPL